MVKPGGTGKPRLAISARPAPLPPRRLRMPARPSALPLPKRETHLVLAEAVFGAAGWRAAALGPDAGRAVFLFDRVRRDGDVTMEPQTWMRPAPNDPRRGRRRKGADGCGGGSADEVVDAVQSNEADD